MDGEPAGEDDTARAQRLEEENQALHEQVKRLVRTERRLYRTQNELDRQLSLTNGVNAFALEAGRADDREEVLALALGLIRDTWAYEDIQAYLAGDDGFELVACHPSQGKEITPPPMDEGILDQLAMVVEGPLILGPDPEPELAKLRARLFDQIDEATATGSATRSVPQDVSIGVLPLVLPGRGFAGVIMLRRHRTSKLSYHESLPADGQDPMLRLVHRNVVAALENRTLYHELEEAARTLEAKVEARTEELERSNADLQQFAYVASHDLQEPLRMVSSYVQLLERRYAGQLDEDAEAFIGFAVEGVQRMQTLIRDLLAYSRVESQGEPFCETDLMDVVEATTRTLQMQVEDTQAQIEWDQLPTVQADPAQMRQLFQNLLSNALKFHGEDPPHIRISGRPTEAGWEIAVEDDGIGIDPAHQERIFVIFQRLHDRSLYQGTGIGLAICKRIVERHGGTIQVASTPGEGSRFTIHLPDDPGQATDHGASVGLAQPRGQAA